MIDQPPDRYTDAQLEAGIVNALRAGDVEAVEAILLVLVGQNPTRGAEVFETLKLGVTFATRAVPPGVGESE